MPNETRVLAAPVPQTSIASSTAPPGETTVVFLRSFEFYNRGQMAGFAPQEALRLVDRKIARIVHVNRPEAEAALAERGGDPMAGRMVKKG